MTTDAIPLRLLWQPAHGWRDLTDEIAAELTAGAPVAWVSFSGTVNVLQVDFGPVLRCRVHIGVNPHAADARWQNVGAWRATACGATDDTGYRSSPPRAVVVLDRPTELDGIPALLSGVHVPTDWRPLHGHPDAPCLAYYCQVREDR